MKTSRGADPPYASKFTPTATRPDPPSKLQILFCKLSVALKTLFLVKKKVNAIFQEGRERNSRAQMKFVNPRTCLSRFAEQLHLHNVCTFLFQKSAYADPSRYALPKYLGLIQGNDLDCCRWVMDPPRGAGSVMELTN